MIYNGSSRDHFPESRFDFNLLTEEYALSPAHQMIFGKVREDYIKKRTNLENEVMLTVLSRYLGVSDKAMLMKLILSNKIKLKTKDLSITHRRGGLVSLIVYRGVVIAKIDGSLGTFGYKFTEEWYEVSNG